MRRGLFAAVVALAACAALVGGGTRAFASSNGNPSFTCTNDYYFSFEQEQFVLLPNGGVSHGGCVSTDARYGYADLENEAVLSNAALISNCKLLVGQFEQMAAEMMPVDAASAYFGLTFTSTNQVGDYIFSLIFGPNPSTCAAILAADHATIASPGPDGQPYDVYYTGGNGKNTTYLPGVPSILIPIFGS